MTEPLDQSFFREQFQGVLQQLVDENFAGALGLLVDVREAGFVNKELDAHIDHLREKPVNSVVETIAWVELVIERLRVFQGDVLRLVDEFSEAEVGLSEAEWQPLESSVSSVASAGFDDFDVLDAISSFDDIEDFDGFDDSDFDFELGDASEVMDFDGSDGDVFGDIEDLEIVDEPLDLQPPERRAEGEKSGGFGAVSDSISDGFDVAEASASEPDERDAKSIDFALIESQAGIGALESSDEAFDFLDDIEDVDKIDFFDDFGEPEETRATWQTEVELAEGDDESNDKVAEEQLPGDVTVGPFSTQPIDDEPDSRIENESASTDDDELDFDFGFENPEQRNQQLNRAGSSGHSDLFDEVDDANFAAEAKVDEADSDGWGQGFDFGFDEESDSEEPLTSVEELQDESSSASLRGLEVTPPSMPAIPRFAQSKGDESPRLDKDETTAPSEHADEVEELRTRASLDDDAFFELAASLAGDSSAMEVSPPEDPKKNSYRGEPLMRDRTSTPLATDTTYEAAQNSVERARQSTPNPFANEEPTGVHNPVMDANSSFVLEEIRPSEVHEDDSAVTALMDEATRLYEGGEFESAHDLLGALMVRDDVSDEARELAAAVDSELERAYQAKLGSLSKSPSLDIDMRDIASMNLDHRFGYLLSQIDGMSSFEDILELSSMSRLETLDVLVEMLGREIICV